MGRVVLVVGGQKAGKSTAAMTLARRQGTPILLAPAEAGDDELAERIARHRADRARDVKVVEGYDLVTNLTEAPGDRPVIIDALDTWLLHRMELVGLLDVPVDAVTAPLGPGGHAGQDAVLAELDRLLDLARDRAGWTIVVAGTIGMGLHGPTPLARRYEDLHGLALQRVGRVADPALLLVAGRALPLPRLDALDLT